MALDAAVEASASAVRAGSTYEQGANRTNRTVLKVGMQRQASAIRTFSAADGSWCGALTNCNNRGLNRSEKFYYYKSGI